MKRKYHIIRSKTKIENWKLKKVKKIGFSLLVSLILIVTEILLTPISTRDPKLKSSIFYFTIIAVMEFTDLAASIPIFYFILFVCNQ